MAKPSPSSDSAAITMDLGRIRSSRACLHCSRRKVKCDALQPCNNCSKDSIVCEYGAQKKRGPPKGCDPRGGRKKTLQEPPTKDKSAPSTTTSAKRKPSSSSTQRSEPRSSNDARLPQPQQRTFMSQKRADSSSSLSSTFDLGHVNGYADSGRTSSESPRRELHPGDRAISSSSQSALALLTARPSSDTRFAPDERSAIASHPPYYGHQTWSRSSCSLSIASSPPLQRRSSHVADNTPLYPTSTHGSQHSPTTLHQHYLQPQRPLQHHPDYHRSESSWPASDARSSQQYAAPSGHHYDAFPMQGSLREYHRSSPLALQRPVLLPHTSAPSYPVSDPVIHPSADRAASSISSNCTNPAASTSTFASPSSHASRSLCESPGGHHHSGVSLYDKPSAIPSSSTLSSRHPVSASRLSEPATGSSAAYALASSSTHSTGVNPSPAFTGASHGYSPSSTAMPHRPWYNGSQPPSPRGPASILRSHISSPAPHWLDHHVRPSLAAANDSHSSTRIYLEDRLPPHILQRLLDIYQVFVHPHWPILYIPSVTSLHSLRRSRPIVFEAMLAVASNTFDAYMDSSNDDDQQSANPVLELLYANSPQGPEQSWKSNELRDHFVHRVKTRIFEGKFAQDIGTVQAAILISVIELGCGNTSSAFQFGGIACRMALDMNLHRCITHNSNPTSSNTHQSNTSQIHGPTQQNGTGRGDPHLCNAHHQERLRVFWACFILDKILSTTLDKPAQLRSAEIETDWPSVQEADEYDLWINKTTRKFVEQSQLARFEGVKVHALSSFKAWAEVMAILERILEEVYSPQAKRDRRRTKGTSDYEALLRLNDRLSKWRSDLPAHLKWTGTWTSAELLSTGKTERGGTDRKECEPHRGLPPQILTMRSWYCICLILLHRPRVPKLLEGPKERSAAISEKPEVAAAEAENASAIKEGERQSVPVMKRAGDSGSKDRHSEPAGLDFCNAAAKEVCDILHAYGSSFRIRKISSSWVYLIFQSATIHAALAASKSVVAFKARQSSIWSRRGSKISSSSELAQSTLDVLTGTEGADFHGADSGDIEPHPEVTEAELEGSSDLVKTSALYLAECVRYLKRIGPTWQSASNHVAVLRNLCIASVQARPLSPALTDATTSNAATTNGGDQGTIIPGCQSTLVKHEEHDCGISAHHTTNTSGMSGHGHQHDHRGVDRDAQRQNGLPDTTRSHIRHPTDLHISSDHPVTTSSMVAQPANPLQSQFLQDLPPGAHPHEHGLPLHGPHQMAQAQVQCPINANDSTFWASMPVASEGYNEWDEFFKAFNPTGTASGEGVVGAQGQGGDLTGGFHLMADVDLITALQDPNRLLSGIQQHQGHH
ncbi:uncharacterized protein MEPE_06735 [Melanopsichium pennsylvanicum]|uniref:Zn(2)-C6 fungal-type domain-containing protein n=2 Tax=Melanopsichium pennsylvanicum TaxID=63383 RepID=A0AAJ4XSV9_9BASI|nr:potential fungal zinc cluster transcription factor [Melanopsichium pennsylvanicum 4]SNX88024.1 uncharacterized protein MEPE_06735 [Melanopsichium pennsylvanicum]